MITWYIFVKHHIVLKNRNQEICNRIVQFVDIAFTQKKVYKLNSEEGNKLLVNLTLCTQVWYWTKIARISHWPLTNIICL